MNHKIKEYLNSTKLKMNYIDDKLNIVNYTEIILLTNDKIIIKKDNQIITIKGSDLSLLKLLESEILIQGCIKTIEL